MLPLPEGAIQPLPAAPLLATQLGQARDAALLVLGSRVEILLKALLNSGELDVRLRTLDQAGTPQAWSRPLRVGLTRDLQAAAPEALRPGTRLHAQVVALSPRVMLRLFTPEEDPLTARRTLIDAQLRLHLPGARALAPTLSSWQQRLSLPPAGHLQTALPSGPTQTPSAAQAALPESRPAVQQILEHVASPRELTDPVRLQETLRHSGVWLEALLARALVTGRPSPNLERDLKVQLLRLAAQLRQTPVSIAPGPNRSPSSPPPRPANQPGAQTSTGTPAKPATAPNTATPSTAPSPSNQPAATPTPRTAPPATHARPAASPSPQPASPTGGATDPAQAAQARAPSGAEQTGARLFQLTQQLTREVDGLLKQLVTLQLQNADQTPEQTRWALELPVQTKNDILTIDTEIEHQNQGAEGEEHWSMRLRLDLALLGPILIQLSLRAGRLSASLVAERHETAQRLQRHLPDLRTKLEARELDIASLHARRGPTGRPPPTRPPLLNERA